MRLVFHLIKSQEDDQRFTPWQGRVCLSEIVFWMRIHQMKLILEPISIVGKKKKHLASCYINSKKGRSITSPAVGISW
jgi:hypothetical protein